MAFALKTGVILAQGNFAQGKRQITEGDFIDTGGFVNVELNKMFPTLSWVVNTFKMRSGCTKSLIRSSKGESIDKYSVLKIYLKKSAL